MLVGVDYGSKFAGTTALCFDSDAKLHLSQSTKKSDADAFIQEWVAEHNPDLIMLDAPLSLPSVYTGGMGTNYHFRACDVELGAMSPMFLGGLTARAMKLRANLSVFRILETYPRQVHNRHFAHLQGYKDTEHMEHYATSLEALLPYPFETLPQNLHQIDSALAWYVAWLYSQAKCVAIGVEEEGLIYV
jgi:uncharacterized protein